MQVVALVFPSVGIGNDPVDGKKLAKNSKLQVYV